MAVSVRLDRKTEILLGRVADTLNVTKSKVIKKSLENYCYKVLEERPHPYFVIKEAAGKYRSGRNDLASNDEKILREKWSRRKK